MRAPAGAGLGCFGEGAHGLAEVALHLGHSVAGGHQLVQAREVEPHALHHGRVQLLFQTQRQAIHLRGLQQHTGVLGVVVHGGLNGREGFVDAAVAEQCLGILDPAFQACRCGFDDLRDLVLVAGVAQGLADELLDARVLVVRGDRLFHQRETGLLVAGH